MARPKALRQTQEVKAYLSQDNYAKLGLLCYSPELGKLIHGEQSRIINEALSLYFSQGAAECSPPKSTPASTSSEQLHSSEN